MQSGFVIWAMRELGVEHSRLTCGETSKSRSTLRIKLTHRCFQVRSEQSSGCILSRKVALERVTFRGSHVLQGLEKSARAASAAVQQKA